MLALQNRQTGFTLMELMITLVVMAILAAIALPSFQSIIENRRLAGAADNLFSDLQFARSEAIKQNQTVQFQFNTGNWCYGIDDDGANCDCTNPASCTVNTAQKVVSGSTYKNVALSVTGFTGTTINFDSRRGIPSDNGTFTLTINGKTKSINLSAIGKVKVN